MKVLVTGVAGFIGSFVAKALLERGDEVVGIDNLNDYYDPSLKRARLDWLTPYPGFRFAEVDIRDTQALHNAADGCQRICHLAAQAGVRYSFANPRAYVESNLDGFFNILEVTEKQRIEHLVFASTSSVYGANTAVPFRESGPADHPMSFYAATKKANELMAHAFAHLHGLPMTGLRFFTVYGPWGRPDMALFRFTRMMLAGESIPVYGHGRQSRDFTYIDDIVAGVIRTIDQPASPNPQWSGDAPEPSSSSAPWRIYNIGNQAPVPLMRFIEVLQECLGVTATLDLQPMVPGDVPNTWADTSTLDHAVGYQPDTPIETGVARFVEWYRNYYQI